ncbi:hypothetical protein [Pontibacter liquoris]|uniref:hypothetical protein n=1 Tax=Pontibacter liquoris TaxID=2905677 RepID=UPI001FA7D728|nr:hypothetical protein [Pontibacter liquoris]
MKNKVEIGGYYNIKAPTISIVNSYTTLGGHRSKVQNLYKYRQMGFVAKVYPFTNYFGEQGIYVGGSADRNFQIPIDNLSVVVDNSRLYQEISNYNSFGFSGIIGYKKDFEILSRNRIGISIEIKYSVVELRSQSFIFNVFGNADPQDFSKKYSNLGATLGVGYYLNLN